LQEFHFSTPPKEKLFEAMSEKTTGEIIDLRGLPLKFRRLDQSPTPSTFLTNQSAEPPSNCDATSPQNESPCGPDGLETQLARVQITPLAWECNGAPEPGKEPRSSPWWMANLY
jgi:hypothetical protein